MVRPEREIAQPHVVRDSRPCLTARQVDREEI